MRALVLSGGANKGAWQFGALRYLINDLNISYDILCGVSVGALNCSYLSMFPKEREKDALKSLETLWDTITDAKVKKSWCPLGVVHGLWLDSIYNSQPLIDMVHADLNLDSIRKSGRQIAVGAVSMNTGEYRIFTQDDDCFVDGVLASSSYPMGLRPIIIDNQKWTDGGVKHIVPLQEAIDFGATDIDVIICAPPKTTAVFNDVDAVTFGMRCFDFMTDQMVQSDLKIADLYNQLVDARINTEKKHINIKVIRPTANLELSPLSFDNTSIKKLIEQGYSEAKQQYIV